MTVAPIMFFRLLAHQDKGAALADAVEAVREGRADGEAVHPTDSQSFRLVPGSPFAYWVSDALRRKFVELPPFEGEGRIVRVGLQTSDDFRFVRAWWEVAPQRILDGANGPYRGDTEDFQAWCRRRTFDGRRWAPFAKGGEYSPYYADVHLLVNWNGNGREIRSFERAFIRNEDSYFRPGLTWPRRSQRGLSVRAMPAGCAFADKGPAAFAPINQTASLLALANSSVFLRFVSLQMAFGSYEVGVMQRSPLPLSRVAS